MSTDNAGFCDVREASCRCREPAGHEGLTPHACPCGGKWEYTDNGNLVIIQLPPASPIPQLRYDDEDW